MCIRDRDLPNSHGRQFDCKQHPQYKGHQQKEKGTVETNIITSYCINVKKLEYDSITAHEVGIAYHSVKDSHCMKHIINHKA